MSDVGNNSAGLNCPACGTPMYYGEKFCPRCGYKIETQQAMPMLDKSEPTVNEGTALSGAEKKTVFSSKETGTFTVKVYDKSTGEYLGEGSIHISG